jgi:hypothetical protein
VTSLKSNLADVRSRSLPSLKADLQQHKKGGGGNSSFFIGYYGHGDLIAQRAALTRRWVGRGFLLCGCLDWKTIQKRQFILQEAKPCKYGFWDYRKLG